jgi:hypothetical protein
MKLSFCLAPAVLLALSGAACDVRVSDKGGISLDVNEGGRAEDETTQSYPLSKGGRLEVQVSFSNVELVSAAGAQVEVHARRQVRAKTDDEARALLKEQSFTVETAPDRVSVRDSKPEGIEAWRRRARVDYRIGVPAGSVVTIKNENGRVDLSGVDGRFTLDVTNGRVMARSVSGGLEATAVNSVVIVEMKLVASDVKISTVNGHAILGIPPNTNATVDASTVNGRVVVLDTLPIEATTKDAQRLSGRVGTGAGPRIELRTTNGNARLGGGEPPT